MAHLICVSLLLFFAYILKSKDIPHTRPVSVVVSAPITLIGLTPRLHTTLVVVLPRISAECKGRQYDRSKPISQAVRIVSLYIDPLTVYAHSPSLALV